MLVSLQRHSVRREAPGYKGLILRPHDLKSIKAAVTRGSKAAVAAIEELEQGDWRGTNSDQDH